MNVSFECLDEYFKHHSWAPRSSTCTSSRCLLTEPSYGDVELCRFVDARYKEKIRSLRDSKSGDPAKPMYAHFDRWYNSVIRFLSTSHGREMSVVVSIDCKCIAVALELVKPSASSPLSASSEEDKPKSLRTMDSVRVGSLLPSLAASATTTSATTTADVDESFCSSSPSRRDQEQEDFVVLNRLLTESECTQVIDSARSYGFASTDASFAPGARDADRLCIVDKDLASLLFERLTLSGVFSHANLSTVVPFGFSDISAGADADGFRWRPVGINPCMRLSAYRAPSTGFTPHYDSPFIERDDVRSALGVVIYLNDTFTGGETILWPRRTSDDPPSLQGITVDEEEFLSQGSGQASDRVAIQPRTGRVLLLPHTRLHAAAPVSAPVGGPVSASVSELGEEVKECVKYILRTDVMYERVLDTSSPISSTAAATTITNAEVTTTTAAAPMTSETKQELEDEGTALDAFRNAQHAEMEGDLTRSKRLYERSLSIRRSHPLIAPKSTLIPLVPRTPTTFLNIFADIGMSQVILEFCTLGEVQIMSELSRMCLVIVARFRDLFWNSRLRKVHSSHVAEVHGPSRLPVFITQTRTPCSAIAARASLENRTTTTTPASTAATTSTAASASATDRTTTTTTAMAGAAGASSETSEPLQSLRSRAYMHLYIPEVVRTDGCQTHYRFINHEFVQANLEGCVRVMAAYTLYSFGHPGEDSFVVCHDPTREFAQKCSVEWLLTCVFYNLPCSGTFYHLYKNPVLDMRSKNALRTCGPENCRAVKLGKEKKEAREHNCLIRFKRANATNDAASARFYCYSSQECGIKDSEEDGWGGYYCDTTCEHHSHQPSDGKAEATDDEQSASMPAPSGCYDCRGRNYCSAHDEEKSDDDDDDDDGEGDPEGDDDRGMKRDGDSKSSPSSNADNSDPPSLPIDSVSDKFAACVERSWLTRDKDGKDSKDAAESKASSSSSSSSSSSPSTASLDSRATSTPYAAHLSLSLAIGNDDEKKKSGASERVRIVNHSDSDARLHQTDPIVHKTTRSFDGRDTPTQGYDPLIVEDRMVVNWDYKHFCSNCYNPRQVAWLPVTTIRLNNVIVDFSRQKIQVEEEDDATVRCKCRLDRMRTIGRFSALVDDPSVSQKWKVSLSELAYQGFWHAGTPPCCIMGKPGYVEDATIMEPIRRMARVSSRESIDHLHVERFSVVDFVVTYRAVGSL